MTLYKIIAGSLLIALLCATGCQDGGGEVVIPDNPAPPVENDEDGQLSAPSVDTK